MISVHSGDIEKIYAHIADSESKEIFTGRLMYALTGDMKYIRNVIRTTSEGNAFYNRMTGSAQKKIVFGAGAWGNEIISTYEDLPFESFLDNRVKNETQNMNGMPVISFEKYLQNYKDEMVIIASRLFHQSMYEQLKENGVKEENIVNAGKTIDDMSKRQYFDLPELKDQNRGSEYFVDAGCFDGRTSVLFAEWCEGNYSRIWGFEPDEKNAEACRNILDEKRSEVIEKGLWDEETELCFESGANGSSKVSEDGGEKISAVKLDDVIHDHVTFIKMDIERAELKALKGGGNLIMREKPRLAISVYHKPEDIVEIPLFICEINPEYRLYLRHYSIAAAETVLYAV